MIQKIGISVVIFLVLLNLASAINLQIEKTPVRDVVIKELNQPAIFDFKIKNLGETDNFQMYSLVGVDMSPKDSFRILRGEVANVTMELTPLEGVVKNEGYFTFVYKIKGETTGTQEDQLTIRVVSLKNSIGISADNINPESDKITVYVQNKENFTFNEIAARLTSVFFDFEENFSLAPLEKKAFTVDLDKQKVAALVAGPYIISSSMYADGVLENYEATMKFLEKSDLATTETNEGFLIYRTEIEKRNEGNLVTVAEIKISKNLISSLFTTFSVPPTSSKRSGGSIVYSWQEELRPGESLSVVAKTNWALPIVILIAVIVIIVLYRMYLTSDVILKKKINFVKTKGGEFALKVSVSVKGRRFVERINIVDNLPPIVKLYERYGTIAPDKIDATRRRLEWNIESLNKDENRLFSYIIYSKIGVVGRFELPPARAVYERDGKIKETESNRVFFLSQPKKIKQEKFDL